MEAVKIKIEEVQANKKIAVLKAKITELKTRQQKGEHWFQEGTIQDETGDITITFWNEQAGQFEIGDIVVISDGWCKEFQDNLMVSSGKFGTIKKAIK